MSDVNLLSVVYGLPHKYRLPDHQYIRTGIYSSETSIFEDDIFVVLDLAKLICSCYGKDGYKLIADITKFELISYQFTLEYEYSLLSHRNRLNKIDKRKISNHYVKVLIEISWYWLIVDLLMTPRKTYPEISVIENI
ncbi:hypothetical protein [Methylomonas sp. AM2-LC]|uniref:hypothetical protein n=1 Tax=Methylomonas sp. AM2-LC TaxID=3153301 RepID=UPI003264F8F1